MHHASIWRTNQSPRSEHIAAMKKRSPSRGSFGGFERGTLTKRCALQLRTMSARWASHEFNRLGSRSDKLPSMHEKILTVVTRDSTFREFLVNSLSGIFQHCEKSVMLAPGRNTDGFDDAKFAVVGSDNSHPDNHICSRSTRREAGFLGSRHGRTLRSTKPR